MRSALNTERRELYDALLKINIAKRRAIQLQNLMEHCKYATFKIDCELQQIKDCDMVIVSVDIPAENLAAMANKAREEQLTLCIMSPSLDHQRDKACQAIVEAHPCTSVDNHGYLLLFNNYLPKQKFRL